jgi:ribosome biogenesis GTPase
VQYVETTLDVERNVSGVVFKKTQGEYTVHVDGRRIPCSISNSLRKKLIYHTAAGCKHDASDPAGCPKCRPNGAHRSVVKVTDIHEVDPVAIGDSVRFVPDGDRGVIVEIMPRTNTLIRRAAGARRLKQIIAANVDQVLAVMSAAQPQPSWNLLDRYLAAAEEWEIPALVVITKIDLVDPSTFEAELETYRGLDYPVLLTSAERGDGMPGLMSALGGRVSVVAGKSGVGKTSLLNAVQPELGQRVGEVSRQGPSAGKGKHTTSHVEMFGLDGGGGIVDTPGMREFGLWDSSSERQRQEHEEGDLALLFRDLRPFVGQCRFGLDCSHVHEPRCAIRHAVDAGDVSERRYRSYLRLAGRA